jgi:hypothetical protein
MSSDKTFIPFVGEVTVGDTIQFPGDTDSYAVLGINEDGIVIKKLDIIRLAEEVMNDNKELLKALSDD